MTYRVQFAEPPEGFVGATHVLQDGIPESDLPWITEKARSWNAQAAENAAAGMPFAMAFILGQALGTVEIVSEDGDEIAIPL